MWHKLAFVAESRRLDAQQLSAFALARVEQYGLITGKQTEVNTWHVDQLVEDYRGQVTDVSPAALLALGFTAVTYSGPGTFYRRDTVIGSMPMLQKAIDGDRFVADGVAVTEVRPDGTVSLLIPDTGHAEEADARRPDGQALLRDSIAGRALPELLAL